MSSPKPRSGAPRPAGPGVRKAGHRPQGLVLRPSDRLHVAVLAALIAVGFALIAFPLTSSGAGDESPGSAPAVVVADGFAAALQSQAQTVVSALAQAGPAATPEGRVLSQGRDELPGAHLVPRPLLVAAAQLVVQGALAGPDGERGMAMELQHPVRFTLYEGGFPSVVFSTRPTVGAALTALGAEYTRYDLVWPSPETPLTAGLNVYVERAIAVSLSVGGKKPAPVFTHAETVAHLLAERDISLSERDSVAPGPKTRLRDAMAVSVTLVGVRTVVEDTSIPRRTSYQYDASLPSGQYLETQAGWDGFVRREYRVVYENGLEVSRDLVSARIVAPVNRIVAVGTAAVAEAAPVAAPVAAPRVVSPGGDLQCASTMTVYATWYTAASAGGSGTTATGTTVEKGIVAVDPSVIPLGTRMYVPGYGYATAADTGGAIVGNIIDLGYGADDVKDWSTRWVDICILAA